MQKSDIEEIETEKPPGVFRMGNLKILLKSGQTIEVKVGKQREYQQLRDVMTAFYPELVRSK